MTERYALSDLFAHWPPDAGAFVACASFESRCKSIANACGEFLRGIEFKVLLHYQSESSLAAENFEELRNLLGEEANVGELSLSDPLKTADALITVLSDFRSQCPDSRLVIDITTMTRETVLILLKLLDIYKCLRRTTLLYNPVESMGNTWLTRGVREYRPVLGYGGSYSPVSSLRLLVMPGFELERTKQLIDQYEPENLSIAVPSSDSSVSRALHERNMGFIERVEDWFGGSVDQFSCSVIDPKQTMTDLWAHIEQYLEENLVIAPLNTKFSTVGAGLLGLCKEEVQIGYSEVASYHESEYSSGSNEVMLFDCSSLGSKPWI